MATEKQILSVIKKQLASFNEHELLINDDVRISSVFASPTPISKNNPTLFKGNILWTLNHAKHEPSGGGKNRFPAGWMDLTAAQLAQKLFLIIAMFCLPLLSFSQVSLSVGTIKTDFRKNALNIAFAYLKDLDSTYGNKDYMVTGKKSYFLVTPEALLQSGTQDAFSSIILKATGNYVKFRTTVVDGLETPDADKMLHVWPVSLGAETNNQFSYINGLLEFGYEPYYNSPLSKSPTWLKHTKFGVYLQTGYKFDTGVDTIPVGGAKDQSAEKPNGGIFRAKANLYANTGPVITMQGLRIGLTGQGTTWYDILHSEVYYRLAGTIRFYLTSLMYFDVQYAKGSGAPNFNQGDQYGVGLTITY